MQKQEKIRLGFIGAGGISRFHMAAAAKLADRVTLQAVCDINETAAEEKAEKYGIRFVYTDYKDLLASPDIDAVIITLPNFLHAKVSVEALEAGKHVLCEKPMVTNAAEAHAVIRAWDQSGKQFMVSMNNRFRKAAQWIHHYVQSGKLGKVYYAKTGWIRRRGIPVWGTWFFDKNLSGGGQEVKLFREENGVPADVLLHFEENDERFDVFESFITSIENNTPPLCTAEQGLLIGKILESVYQSSEQGKQVFMEW
jgi:predicted dehydrogenase